MIVQLFFRFLSRRDLSTLFLMIEFKDPVAEHIKALVLDETALEIDNREYSSDPVWSELADRGSRIWLRGCDKLASEIWSSDMEAICSDTYELGKAVRRGEYRSLIKEANHLLKGLPPEERIGEIAFILNARRAIRMSKQFAAKVSVEVPPIPGGADEMEQYGQRLFQICPEHILIALPFSPEGLNAAQALGRLGVPVTINNQYSLQQAIQSLHAAAPAYMAVTFGQNGSDRSRGPEKAQQLLRFFADMDTPVATRLIADGLDTCRDIQGLIGFPILMISPQTAAEYRRASTNGSLGEARESSSAAEVQEEAQTGYGEELSSRLNRERLTEYKGIIAEIAQTIASI